VGAAAAAAGKAKVYGPALEKAVKTFESTYLIVDCKEAGPGLCLCRCKIVAKPATGKRTMCSLN